MKTRRSSSVRGAGGKFENKYGMLIHESNNSQLYDYRKSRKIKQSIINHLINTNLLSQRVKFVCQDCLDQVSEPIKSLSSAQVVNEGFVPENNLMDVNAAIPN